MMAFALALTVGAVALTTVLRHEPERAVAVEAAVKSAVEPPVRSYPPVEPRVEEAKKPQPVAKPPKPEAELVREPQPEPHPKPSPQVKPQAQPQPVSRSTPEQRTLPVAEDDWAPPTDEELQAVNAPPGP